MYNLWAFLLQTLTVSGIAVFLLVIKHLLKDKLTPSWHFMVWSVLGISVLFPAGMHGRYSLINWRFVVELIKSYVEDYSYIKISHPFPVIRALPSTIPEWIFVIYIAGVWLSILRYALSYIQLKRMLKTADTVDEQTENKIRNFTANHKLKVNKIVRHEHVPTSFVYGIFHPVLVLSKDDIIDDKIILHELFHIKNKDTFWSMMICILRSLHWCNPLLTYCADRALSDMESRCDQYVMELLEGEERRDYGRILLAMTNEQFANTPGCTGINNGGKKISERIETIARFKQYPAGMHLVSFCIIILLAFALTIGVQANKVSGSYRNSSNLIWNLSSARSTPCSTYAGAMDTYGKAVLSQNYVYRAMCTAENDQEKLVEDIQYNLEKSNENWTAGLEAYPKVTSGYYIYNLKEQDHLCDAMLVIELNYPPYGKPAEDNTIYLAYQNIQAIKEYDRWIIKPLEAFQYLETKGPSLDWGCMEVPGVIYSASACGFKAEVKYQTVHRMDNYIENANSDIFTQMMGSSSMFDTTPKPNANFTEMRTSSDLVLIHQGTREERDEITQAGLSVISLKEGEERPVMLTAATGGDHGGSSTSGESYNSRTLEKGWNPIIQFGGGGSSYSVKEKIEMPASYAADLYINNKRAASITLYPEGGDRNE